jgi:hypothetical protein
LSSRLGILSTGSTVVDGIVRDRALGHSAVLAGSGIIAR